jgi:hypothetical protein
MPLTSTTTNTSAKIPGLEIHTETLASSTNVEWVVPGSQYFRRFTVHINDGQNTQTVDVEVSHDGTNWGILKDDIVTLGGAGTDQVFEFETQTPWLGGIRIKFTNNIACTVIVRMYDNPFANKRRRN